MRVSDVMERDVATVTAEVPLRDVANLLFERGFSGLPVVENGGRVVGVVSEADVLMKERASAPRRGGLLGWLLEPQTEQETTKHLARTAGEAMTSPAITVEPTVTVSKAAALMIESGINRLPVVAEGKLVGIVTRADLVRAFVRDDAAIAQEIRHDVMLQQFWIEPQTLTVEVKDGLARLAGEVDRRSVAELLASYVERVPGVVAVESQLSWREDDRP
jgi:CBS domain-containing protein